MSPIPFLAAGAGYLLGALPFAYLVARAKGVDIFKVGSGNAGATNVLRVMGPGPGGLVFFLDGAKGALAAGWPLLPVAEGGETSSLCGLVGAILGHSFSCFTGFRGGKSVATAAGGFAVLFPVGAAGALGVFAVTLALFRYVALSSMLGAVALAVSSVVLGRSGLVIGVSCGAAGFVILRHRANISRLLAGTEARIGRKPSPPSASSSA
ncbi:MAG: glycerol-3-phosphate 1-O-acyltransferase PlsY [Opitutaceae bacterium]